ncbi:MAG TPA: NepR family anti-sigma factor [Xanthobacteraceae bacterium]|nr:NepR family anti-sigma factor [Xanthobacteraceae bacterium]
MQNTRTGDTAPGAGLSREATIKIGQQLRAMYDEVVKEGVPDRFSELLKRLDGEGAKGGSEGPHS